jgi:hypothetical protein
MNSFAKYYEDIEDPADSACETEQESEKFKVEPTEFDNNSESKEIEKLKSFLEDNKLGQSCSKLRSSWAS